MTNSSVYLRAAEYAHKRDTETPSCCAVDMCGGSRLEGFTYSQLFHPKILTTALWGRQWGATAEEQKACRVLALCFMAAITEWEEKHER